MPEWVTNRGRSSLLLQALFCRGFNFLLGSKVRESLRSDGDRDLEHLIPSAPLASQRWTSWHSSRNSQVTLGQWKCHIDFCLWFYYPNLLLFHKRLYFFLSLFSSQFSSLKCFSLPAGIPLPQHTIISTLPWFASSPPPPSNAFRINDNDIHNNNKQLPAGCTAGTQSASPQRCRQVVSRGPPSWSWNGWATGKQVGERGWYPVRLLPESLRCQSFWQRNVRCSLVHCGSWGLCGWCALCQSQYDFQRKLSNSVCWRRKNRN